MPCDDCLTDLQDLLAGGCTNPAMLAQYITTALERLCPSNCRGELTTLGLSPITDPVDATAEAFPSLPCGCGMLLIQDTDGELYWSIDDGDSWHLIQVLPQNNVAATAPTINDDSDDGYSIGSRWVDTATDLEYVLTDATVGAANWVQTTGATTQPALVEIASGKLLIAAATIDINAIPATYQDLILVIRARSTAAQETILMRFNSDNAANYSAINEQVTGTTEAHANANNLTEVPLPKSLSANTSTAGYFSFLEVTIGAYANAAITRVGTFESVRFETATSLARAKGGFAWENVANAISSINLSNLAGSFEIGTTWHLYARGIKL